MDNFENFMQVLLLGATSDKEYTTWATNNLDNELTRYAKLVDLPQLFRLCNSLVTRFHEIDLGVLEYGFQRFDVSRTEMFENLSHCFCESRHCNLYKACRIEHWAILNRELMEIEIPFFLELFTKVDSIIDDLESYSQEEFDDEEEIEDLSGCCHEEKLKQLNTVVNYPEWFYDC